ncbi:hypothetical protein HID58_042127, partial [Brassica napus]
VKKRKKENTSVFCYSSSPSHYSSMYPLHQQGWSSVEVVSVIRSGGSGACLEVSETMALPFGFFDMGSLETDPAEETQVLAEESEWRTALPFGFFNVGSPETSLVEETPVLPICLISGDLPSGFIADSAS